MKRKILFSVLGLILLIIVFVAWKFVGPTVHSPEKKYFYLSSSSNYDTLEKELVAQGLLNGTTWFNWTANLVGFKNVKPGRYEINKGMSLVGLVRMLKNGKQSPVNFVITKIRTREVLAERIGRAFECDSADVFRFLNSPDSLKQFNVDTNTVMAIAMPFTYTLKWNSSVGTIIEQFHKTYENFWTEERKAKATAHGLTPVGASTLASIIDEETNSPTDKPKVASVYLNRIAIGMPLQADPTVKFAMKNFSLRRVYNDYLRYDSPYNTYTNRGLPPGPICTPATATIDSVLNSPKTDYIYFAASPAFDGSHVFASDYKEHLKNAHQYQDELNKRNIR
jgi:UPF0755 protein